MGNIAPFFYSKVQPMGPPKSLIAKDDYAAHRRSYVAKLWLDNGPEAITTAIKTLQVGCWFEHVRRWSHQRSAFAVGREVQPETYQAGIDGCVGQHRNLWAKYAHGKHLPIATAARVGLVVPGSAAILSHVLWDVVNFSKPFDLAQSRAWVRKLRPSVQRRLFGERAFAKGCYDKRTGLNQALKGLECEANLDGLAAVVILFREALLEADDQRVMKVGESLHRTLLISGSIKPLSDIADELFEFFACLVLPLVRTREVMLDVTSLDLLDAVWLLNRAASPLEECGKLPSLNRGKARCRQQLLAGKFGFDLRFGLGPKVKLRPDLQHPSAAAIALIRSKEVFRSWGLLSLRDGKVEKFPPDDVWERACQEK